MEGDGHIGFVEAVVGIEQGEGDARFLVGEQKDLVEGLVETFFVGQEGETAGTVELVLEVVGVAYADDEGLHHGAAFVHLAGHVADVAVALIEAVGDDEDDVADMVAAWEVLKGAVEG